MKKTMEEKALSWGGGKETRNLRKQANMFVNAWKLDGPLNSGLSKNSEN